MTNPLLNSLALGQCTMPQAELLINENPSLVNEKDNKGKNALHYAAIHGKDDITNLLLQKMNPILVNAADNDGKTALHYAAQNVQGKAPAAKDAIAPAPKDAVDTAQRSNDKIVKMLLPKMSKEVISNIANDENTKQHFKIIMEEYMKEITITAEQQLALQQQAEHQLALQQQAVQQTEANINQEILKDVNELVREGNDKIQQTAEKAILLLGKTGSGKSTLATIMAGRELQAITDDEEGRLIVDALTPLKDIIISNSKVAETRIPNKCYAEDVVIWDCPGFHDNRGIAQEIANGFYIKRLLETTKALKFVLVIPESALDSNRGVDFIDTVNQLMRSFTDVSIIDGCISLVVTGASQGRKPMHILKSIERITNQNGLITSDVVKTIGYLKKSLHVFHKPSTEGPLEIEYDFLAAINASTKYAVDIADYARISISEASMGYVHHILKTAQNKFSEIVDIILKTASESHGCIDNQNNRLTGSYKTIEKLLPKSIAQLSLKYSSEHKDSKNNEHFADIVALSRMRDVVNVGSTISIDNTNEVLEFLNNILKACDEYIGHASRQQELLKSQIQGYICVINQQMEYIKFFSKLCGQEVLGYLGTLRQPIELCKEAVSKNLEEAIKSIVVTQNHTDPEYYKTALKYLELYSNQEWSTKIQAKIHIYLVDLSETNEAIGHCLKSLHLDKTLPETYSKLGDLLFKAKDYKDAIGCFKAINNSFKIEQCYKKMLEAHPEDPKITCDAADYFASIGVYSKATKLYHHAFSFSQDKDFKAAALHKISHIMDGSQEKATKLAQRAETHDFYDFDSVDPNALQALMGDHFDYHS